MDDRTHVTVHGRSARVLNLLVGVPVTVFGVWLLLFVAIISRRVPDPPPWVVEAFVATGDVTAVSGTRSLAFVGLMITVGGSALLVGGILIAQAFSPDPSFTFDTQAGSSVTFDNPVKLVFVPVGVVLGLATIIVWSSPATVSRPGSIVQWGYVKFSNEPAALFILTFMFGMMTYVFVFSDHS